MKRVFSLLLLLGTLLCVTGCDAFGLFVRQNAGIQNLTFYSKNNMLCLEAGYLDCMGYGVEILEGEDVIIMGERPVAFQPLLGENAIKISLYETKFDKLLEEYETFAVYNANADGAEIKFMLCPSEEHSLYVYVGLPQNITPIETERTALTIPFGEIQLVLGEYK